MFLINKKVKSIYKDGTVLREDQIDQIIEKLAVSGLIPSIQLAGDEVSAPESIESDQDFSPPAIDKIKVPPRPNAFTSRFTGVSLDYETRQQILNQEIDVPDNLRVDEWDELFGDTHDPETGRPLSSSQEIDETETVRQTGTEDNPVDLKSMSREEAEEAYAKLKVGEYFINPADGRVLPKR